MRVLFVINDLLSVPLAVLSLSAVLKQAGHETELAVRAQRDVERTLKEFHPDVLALSSTSGFHEQYLALNRRLKEKYYFLTVLGGAHATFFPEAIEDNGVDAICIGEGEQAFPEFLGRLEQSGRLPTDVRNFWVKMDGVVHKNPLRPLIANLDALPFPDRRLLLKYRGVTDFKTTFVMATRGCPYRCTYCFNHAYNELYRGLGRVVRQRSVDNVIAEVQEAKELFPLQLVIYQDDIFIMSEDWVREYREKWPREVGLPFHCNLRANLVSEPLIRDLRQAGLVSIKMAIETADDRLRNKVLERGMSRQQFLDACRLLHRYGIRFITQSILGIPGGSLEDDLSTLEFNIQCRPDYLFATLLQAYPRTRIRETAKRMGLLAKPEEEEIPASFFHRSTLRLDQRRRVERLRRLYPYIATHPKLFPYTRLLIRLPLGWLYLWLDKIFKGWRLKHRIFPYRLTFLEYLKSLRFYFYSGYY